MSNPNRSLVLTPSKLNGQSANSKYNNSDNFLVQLPPPNNTNHLEQKLLPHHPLPTSLPHQYPNLSNALFLNHHLLDLHQGNTRLIGQIVDVGSVVVMNKTRTTAIVQFIDKTQITLIGIESIHNPDKVIINRSLLFYHFDITRFSITKGPHGVELWIDGSAWIRLCKDGITLKAIIDQANHSIKPLPPYPLNIHHSTINHSHNFKSILPQTVTDTNRKILELKRSIEQSGSTIDHTSKILKPSNLNRFFFVYDVQQWSHGDCCGCLLMFTISSCGTVSKQFDTTLIIDQEFIRVMYQHKTPDDISKDILNNCLQHGLSNIKIEFASESVGRTVEELIEQVYLFPQPKSRPSSSATKTASSASSTPLPSAVSTPVKSFPQKSSKVGITQQQFQSPQLNKHNQSTMNNNNNNNNNDNNNNHLQPPLIHINPVDITIMSFSDAIDHIALPRILRTYDDPNAPYSSKKNTIFVDKINFKIAWLNAIDWRISLNDLALLFDFPSLPSPYRQLPSLSPEGNKINSSNKKHTSEYDYYDDSDDHDNNNNNHNNDDDWMKSITGLNQLIQYNIRNCHSFAHIIFSLGIPFGLYCAAQSHPPRGAMGKGFASRSFYPLDLIRVFSQPKIDIVGQVNTSDNNNNNNTKVDNPSSVDSENYTIKVLTVGDRSGNNDTINALDHNLNQLVIHVDTTQVQPAMEKSLPNRLEWSSLLYYDLAAVLIEGGEMYESQNAGDGNSRFHVDFHLNVKDNTLIQPINRNPITPSLPLE